MTATAMRAGITALALALALGTGVWSTSLAQEAQQTTLQATKDSGQPSGVSTQWMSAQGEAKVVERQGNREVIELEASNLIPNGLYTVWWVNERPLGIGMDMGPGGGSPNNAFRADANGNATAKIEVPANNDYQMMVIAYHADNRTHGESPGEMGETAFNHLKGPWPGRAGKSSE